MSITGETHSSRVESPSTLRRDTDQPDSDQDVDSGSGPLGMLRLILSWLLLFAAVSLLAAVVVVPRLAGTTPYTIMTSSMRPHMPPGTLVVAKTVDPATLHTGDVITYQLRSGQPDVVTHRIVGVGQDGRGERLFTMKGDNNPTTDPAPARAVQIKGKVWYSVPYIGYLNQVITGRQHIIAVYVVAGLLFAYALFMTVSSALDRRRARKEPRQENR
ncbi:signal peptidase I [Gordonia sp. 852002-10350_SCH5691597]|uniref:signal peptidase I n=1 Tax=Gordonia sp. 852002-10350_SCH5691597 TaxID=1834085 RepID=UPI0007EA1396|nr:signal peptidase I [Gordonia sp. 852002-10350_SCH5691597]OBA68813.1 signal peptidase I [Gordonia sp. 852002-10350_SCH5691597]